MATYRKLLKNRNGDIIIPVIDWSTYGRFSRYMNASQNLTALSANDIKMGAKDCDEVKCSYSSSTGEITINQAGMWQLNCGGRYSTAGSTYGLVGIAVNGNLVVGFSGTAYANSSNSRSGHGCCSALVHLAVGDKITLRITPSAAITNDARTHGELNGFCMFPD